MNMSGLEVEKEAQNKSTALRSSLIDPCKASVIFRD